MSIFGGDESVCYLFVTVDCELNRNNKVTLNFFSSSRSSGTAHFGAISPDGVGMADDVLIDTRLAVNHS